jgi:oligopeptide transport system substrate-binding protein
VGFDVSQPPFDDPRVRRAFALATDKEALASVAPGGYASPAAGGFVPPGIPGHSAGIGLPYDPEQARRLMAEAGYPKGGDRGFPVVDALTPYEREPLSQHLQAQWRENLGVEITWQAMEYGAFVDRLPERGPIMFRGRWLTDYPDPDNFLRVGLRRLPPLWRNEAYTGLVEEARRSMDQEKRMGLYRQADKILIEEVAILPLNYGGWHLLVKPWVGRYPVSAATWFWKDVFIEPH